MKKISDYLQELGLSEVEAILYQGLLKIGPTTVKELADHSGIKRITTHFNIESLIEKGLIVQTMHGARRQIIAEPPERLRYLIEQRIDKAKNLQSKFPDFLNTLESIYTKSQENKNVEIKYYVGRQAVMNIYEDSLKAKEFRAYVNCKELSSVFPKNVEKFLRTHKKRKDMQIWEIMENSTESRIYIQKMPKERYYYKFIPKGMNLSVIDYMIFDNKVAIVNLEENTSGIMILNKHYYQNAKALFEFVWRMIDQREK